MRPIMHTPTSFSLKARLDDLRAFIRTCEYKERVSPNADTRATIASAKTLEVSLSTQYISELIASSL